MIAQSPPHQRAHSSAQKRGFGREPTEFDCLEIGWLCTNTWLSGLPLGQALEQGKIREFLSFLVSPKLQHPCRPLKLQPKSSNSLFKQTGKAKRQYSEVWSILERYNHGRLISVGVLGHSGYPLEDPFHAADSWVCPMRPLLCLSSPLVMYQ